MSVIVQYIDKIAYPNFDNHWDDKIFRQKLLEYIGSTSNVLDVGAGAGIVHEMNFKGIAATVCGIDPDERVIQNPYLDEAHIGLANTIPYPENSFDVVFADNVLEHLPDPAAILKEINRVLRPGGVFLGKTPNAWHYMPLISRCTPLSFHRYINRLRGRAEVDTFPTCYAANSGPTIRRLAKETGFVPVSIDRIEGRPEYLRMNALTYAAGWAYERVVNSTELLSPFRIVLMVCLRKQ